MKENIMQNMLKLFLLAIILTISGFAFSQEEEIIEEEVLFQDEASVRQDINLTAFLNLMSSNGDEIIISNYNITPDGADAEIKIEEFSFDIFTISPKADKKIKELLLHNCIFNLNTDEYLVFKDWQIEDFQIVGCDFKSQVTFENISSRDKPFFFIENSLFYDQIRIVNSKFETASLKLKQNEFKAEVIIDSDLKKLEIDTCWFNADSQVFSSREEVKTFYQLEVDNITVGILLMTRNIFNNKGLTDLFSIDFTSSKVEEFEMISNSMQTLNLSSAEVTKSFLVDSLFVEDYIGILNFDFPGKNTNISWYNFSGEKFSIFKTEENMIIAYQAKTEEQLYNNLLYNDLISAYNKFNALYHDRGDIVSANASYVEIKDIETRKQAYVQKVNPSRNNLINYKLNVFLSFFSDYATNPGKSLIYSIYVVLFFAFLYFFTFSKWDGMNFKYFISQFKIFTDYITINCSIYDILSTEKDKRVKDNDERQEVNNLRDEYKTKGKKLPRILKLFGVPLHLFGRFRYDIVPELIRLFNFQQKNWEELKTMEKLWSGFLILFVYLVFLVYVVLVKSFNSLVMSLNSFVVIGFGSLPEEDSSIAMYLSIIQGIIGWFLLTIFTITLLSQVLQSA